MAKQILRLSCISFLTIACLHANAQFPKTFSSSELYHALQNAVESRRILYLAAHPDDENTRLIAFFENHSHAQVAYLSLTRGDGGQNLIGTEIGAAVGVLRTQELLAARNIDGGQQFFTRAVDFGYSKSAEESFEKWGRDEVLSDVVWVIRNFRPDVIITRFPPSRSAGHGHHEASAILADLAFDLASDSSAFPEQLQFVDTWQPKRLYFNASTWWNENLEDKAKNSEDYVRVDVGEYNPLLGKMYAQIAATSRSQHRSQGFGSDYPYGTQVEYLQYVKGSKASPTIGILDGIADRWKEYDLAMVRDDLMREVEKFDFKTPSENIAALVKIAKRLDAAKSNAFAQQKQSEINDLLLKLLGVSISLTTEQYLITRSSTVAARLAISNPSLTPLELLKLQFMGKALSQTGIIKNNDLYSQELTLPIDPSAPYSNPYWLQQPYENLYNTRSYDLIGKAENLAALDVTLTFDIEGYSFQKLVPVRYKIVDPAKAVIFSPVYIVPKLTFNFAEKVMILSGNSTHKATLQITNHGELYSGQVSLSLPDGWYSSPAAQSLFLKAGSSERLVFDIHQDATARGGMATVISSPSIDEPALSLQIIDYDHIPQQIILSEAEMELIPIDMNRGAVQSIGYIAGSGDEVDKYLMACGYDVTLLNSEDIANADLSGFDVIVTGIRAFNTRDDLAFANQHLNEYVENGGTWLVQYNTNRGLKSEIIGPYPFEITRERVTDEKAVARFLIPDHSVLNTPNKLGSKDFDNWVQERGLYFAAEPVEHFEAPLSWNDPDEPPRDGGLIISKFGKGYFVYTGISFFRQLPAGVPGAYRLLANILALGTNSQKSDER